MSLEWLERNGSTEAVVFSKRGKGWAIRWRELEIAPDGTRRRVLRYEALGEISRGEASDILAQKLARQAASKVRRDRA